ncbi:MAG: hypothetical protein U1C74_17570 [Phenylobacterium sp.]|nr:hypothetical protein [Phenylobacterium sp.]
MASGLQGGFGVVDPRMLARVVLARHGLTPNGVAQLIRNGERLTSKLGAQARDLRGQVTQRFDASKAPMQPKPPSPRHVALSPPVSKTTTPPRSLPARRPTGASPNRPTGGLVEQVRAATSGAVDEFTFGLADRALAGGEAVIEGGLANFARNYSANMQEKRAEDAYDAEHYGLARNSGRVLGVAGSVVAMGGPAAIRGAAFLAPKLYRAVKTGAPLKSAVTSAPTGRGAKQAAKLGIKYGPDPRGLTTMSVVGGAGAGALDQYVGDILTGRQTDGMELLVSAVGGGVGGLATRFGGPTLGGVAGGVATSVLQDVSRGDEVSFDRALNSGQLSGIFGGAAGRYVTEKVAQMPGKAKGALGEFASGLKAIARGDEILSQQTRIYLTPKRGRSGYTVADHVLRGRDGQLRYNESKLGPEAIMTPRQIQAMNQFGDRYIVDHWRFSDMGKAGGAAVAPLGYTFVDDEAPRWP